MSQQSGSLGGSRASAGATFADRHIGPRGDEVATMLDAVGVASLEELVERALPEGVATETPLRLPAPRTEAATLARLDEIAAKNVARRQMIGLGYVPAHTPAVLRSGILGNPGWYTSYTPYQPEISQGRLEAMAVFQTMIEDLTGLEVAGSSLLDEATAVAEAVALMRRANRKVKEGVVVLDAELQPQTKAVVQGRAAAAGVTLAEARIEGPGDLPEGDLIGVVLQQPGASGRVRDLRAVVAAAKERGALVTVSADVMALLLLTSPGELGADVAVGSTQRFGIPLFFGGPHAAYMAVRSGLERQLPGRLVGVSKDDAGRPAFRLALQTREQHIRRDRATSNICTAQALLAVVAGMYAAYHGAEGLRRIALHGHGCAAALAAAVRATNGADLVHAAFVDALEVRVPGRGAEAVAAAEAEGVNIRLVDSDTVGVACGETTTPEDLAVVARALGAEADVVAALTDAARRAGAPDQIGAAGWGEPGHVGVLPSDVLRRDEVLTHPHFRVHRSETAMMRWLRRLADMDLALDRTMIPLGSCTMKLNAATEMAGMLHPGLAGIHPLAPASQTAGWRELLDEVEERLAEVTGYARVDVQPNSGAQGEFAGLLTIRNYHRARGDHHRTVCLIPASAHGTNAASAAMAGLRVVVVATAEDGTVDLEDLRAKIDEHAENLAGIMITYPSTHGVFESDVRTVTDAVHSAGGQVYIDGANFNALVGLARFTEMGGDVSHLNLHKTFCIPHGGGGPGVGPVGVAEHLVPFLPGDAGAGLRADEVTDAAVDTATEGEDAGIDGAAGLISAAPVSQAPDGSAGVVPITWAYLEMMGADGLRDATVHALLAANYLAARLREDFPILYTGEGGHVAHECILDLRDLTKRTGVTAEDVAKRLIDFGFHAPTLAFPVAGTLMVEPTESEDLAELDRFVEAMHAIRAEIDQVASGDFGIEESPLRRAPHTAAAVTADEWDRPYSRRQAFHPTSATFAHKYAPPVGRIDGAFGDRNLVCSCPPPEAFAAAYEDGAGEGEDDA